MSRRMMVWGNGYHQLIDAVKPHKAIYLKYHPMHNNKRHKLKLWHQICHEIIQGWDKMSKGEKGEMLAEVQRGWKTVRDGFNRELMWQKQEKQKRLNGEEVKQRKTYGYFHDLLFLLEGKDVSYEDLVVDPLSDEFNEDTASEPTVHESSSTVKQVTTKDRKRMKKEVRSDDDSPDEFEVKRTKTNSTTVDEDKGDEIDDDKHFCLSLVPTFKKLSAKQKFDAKIAMLQILSDITFRNECENENNLALG